MTALALSVHVERWPIAGSFAISRGAKTEAVVVIAELSDGAHRGRGECVPYARYGETVEGVAAAIEAMAQAAAAVAERALLKVKLGAPGDPARIAAVRRAAPRAELIVDANEGWTPDDLATNLAACAQARVTLVEQPLPADRDHALACIARPIAICADESVHGRASLSALVGRYDAVNIKLDKTGGLTEALVMANEAE